MDTKEASNLVGELLNEFLKSGPKSIDHVQEVSAQVLTTVYKIVQSPKDATEDYATACMDFLAQVQKVKGMPVREVFGNSANGNHAVSSSGKHIADNFTCLLPALTGSYNACVENYRKQSHLFFNDQVGQFQNVLLDFLRQVPIGGTKEKLIKSNISKIKSEFRVLPKWSQLFSIYKGSSFAAEIEHVFALEGGAIAAIWHYSELDEEGEFKKTYSHGERDHRVYAVRGNWAIAKGLMSAGPCGYLEEITRPKQEIGCGCHFEYLYTLRDLPEVMLTAQGEEELHRVRQAVAEGAYKDE